MTSRRFLTESLRNDLLKYKMFVFTVNTRLILYSYVRAVKFGLL